MKVQTITVSLEPHEINIIRNALNEYKKSVTDSSLTSAILSDFNFLCQGAYLSP